MISGPRNGSRRKDRKERVRGEEKEHTTSSHLGWIDHDLREEVDEGLRHTVAVTQHHIGCTL